MKWRAKLRATANSCMQPRLFSGWNVGVCRLAWRYLEQKASLKGRWLV
jgi:hypothetical protein